MILQWIKNHKKGTALILAMVIIIATTSLSSSLIILAMYHSKQTLQASQYEQCYGVLRSGIAHALKELNKRTGSDGKVDSNADNDYDSDLPSTTVNGKTYKVLVAWTACGGGRYKVLGEKLDLGRQKLVVYAEKNQARRKAIVMVEASGDSIDMPGEPFVHALYSGGMQNPLNWGGQTPSADEIHSFPPAASTHRNTYSSWTGMSPVAGNIYAGKKLDIHGDAYLAPGTEARSGGVITETSTRVDGVEENPTSSQILLAPGEALDNPVTPDYNARTDVINIKPADFTQYVNYGDQGYTIAKAYNKKQSDPTHIINDPRHIFIKNAKTHDGSASKKGVFKYNVDTTRDDFYLDDMFHPTTASTTSPSHIGGSGVDQETKYDANSTSNTGYQIDITPSGNNKVYLIEGNLWLHNTESYSFFLKTTGTEGTKITFVVKGVTFISDNLLYQSMEKDAIAFVSLKEARDYADDQGNKPTNPTKEGSGDIRFGDPNYGTTYRFCAFMYAENNFYTYNVNNNLYVYGNMTAGNEVNISNGVGANRKSLIIDYDARIQKGIVSLPGLPTDPHKRSKILTFYYEKTFDIKGISETAKGSSSEWK